MRRYLRFNRTGKQRFHKALLTANGATAVIHRTETGLFIELSDGRTYSMSHDAFGPSTNAMTAAVQWARRNGAISVEIVD